MRIIIYILIGAALSSYTSMAQMRVNKSGELWSVWEEAEKKLEAGQFDDAIVLYKAYEPSFSFRLKQVQRLKELYMEGRKLQRAGRYPEAVNIYKKHREFEGVGSLTAFDVKIDECITQMGGPKSSDIKEFERRILASELAYKGQKKLRELDTLGAAKDYKQARNYGGDFSATLKEQYEEGLKITRELREWGERYRKLKSAGLSPEQEQNVLESYRRIKGVPVLNSVELKVREIIAETEGRNSLISFARNCETDLLLNYINQNRTQLQFSESLVSTLNQYRSIQSKISLLKANVENSRTVRSAFFSVDSMVRSVKELPEDVKQSLELCIKNDRTKTFEGYADQARKAGNFNAAKQFEDIAQGKENDIDVIASPCVGTEIFNAGIISIQEKLDECRLVEARKIWDDITLQLVDCEEKTEIIRSNQSVLNTINRMQASERVFSGYKADVRRLLQQRKFKDAKEKYQQMARVETCNIAQRDEEIKRGLTEIESLQTKPMFRIGITGSAGANKPVYKVSNQDQLMSYGLVSSGGLDVSFIDHHNPIDLVGAVEYLNTSYFALNNEDYAEEGYKLSGVSLSLNIKIHPSNTNPDKIRPYIKIGREEIIPVTYEHENYFTLVKTEDKKELKSVISTIQGALGLEMQKKHFGFFIEGCVNYGINGVYNNRASSLAVNGNKEVEANFRRLGIKLGLRFW